jgi:acyl dehydratase
VEIGDGVPPVEIFLSKDQVRTFAYATDMTAARFTDDEGARREGLPGMITPGNMAMALLQKRLTDWAEGAVVRRLGVTFRGLILPDQTLRLQANVVGKSSDEGGATVDLDVWMETADGERAVTGTATVAVPRGAGQVPPGGSRPGSP